VGETSLIGMTVALTVPRFGTNAAWLANTWVDILCVAVMLCYAWSMKKKIDLSPSTVLNLSDSFGAAPDEYREYTVKSMEDVTGVSASVIDFCKERGIGQRTSFFAGVCVEEMATNTLQHGARHGKTPQVDVRIVAQNELTIRIRDNCPEFDPRKRIELFHPETPEKNIGIRLTAGLARQIDYYNSAGINTLIMKI
jgi:anti-sigma regulatory factor (Ser/Thr protein kinase)